MSTLVPFKALRFNPDKISFISGVTAPPYDVIGPDEEQELLDRDPHNVVRITLGRTPSGGRSPEQYQEAASVLQKWKSSGILLTDNQPSLYLVEQQFDLRGKSYTRRGLIAALLQEPLDEQTIFAHERTRPHPTSDRHRLLQASRTVLSQIITTSSDPDGNLFDMLKSAEHINPMLSFRDSEDVGYHIRRVQDPDFIKQLQVEMKKQKLIIADGHHRYESALAYGNENRPAEASRGSLPLDYVPILCISSNDPALKSLPTHRQVKVPDGFDRKHFLKNLSSLFAVRRIKTSDPDHLDERIAPLLENNQRFICVLPDDRLLLMQPREPDTFVSRQSDVPPSAALLPVNLLHRVLLPDLLNIECNSSDEHRQVDFTRHASEVYWSVESGDYSLGFLMPPTSPGLVQELASSQHKLPPKTTYYHPKFPAGIVAYSHDDQDALQKHIQNP